MIAEGFDREDVVGIREGHACRTSLLLQPAVEMLPAPMLDDRGMHGALEAATLEADVERSAREPIQKHLGGGGERRHRVVRVEAKDRLDRDDAREPQTEPRVGDERHPEVVEEARDVVDVGNEDVAIAAASEPGEALEPAL